MSISRANGIDIHYEKTGAGPAIVLLHALPFDSASWLYQVARFSDRFTVLAMDLRGWGGSAKPHTPFTLNDMGEDVLGMLRDEGLNGGTVIMGCGLGSKIALMLACGQPDMFPAAILVGGSSGLQPQFDHRIAGYRDSAAAGTFADYHLGHLRYGVAEAWADSAVGRYLLDGFIERGRILDPESIAQVYRAFATSDLTAKLVSYSTPTMIVNGEHDGTLKNGLATASKIAQVEHHILSGAGHCCFMEAPAAFDDLVIRFLRQHGLWPGE